MALGLDLKTPEEITVLEVLCYWELSKEHLWSGAYRVFISPNKDLKCYVNDTLQSIALMFNQYTGQMHQTNTESLYELVKALGGFI